MGVSVCLPKSRNPTLDRSSMTVSVMPMLVPSCCCCCIPAAPASTCVIPQHRILSFFHPRGSIYLPILSHSWASILLQCCTLLITFLLALKSSAPPPPPHEWKCILHASAGIGPAPLPQTSLKTNTHLRSESPIKQPSEQEKNRQTHTKDSEDAHRTERRK